MEEPTVSDLKLQLKKWESDFLKKNGHKPGKDDISESGQDIQDMYRTYYKQKRALQSVAVWGVELNKASEKEEKVREKEEAKTPSVSIGQKLWEHSKSMPPARTKLKSAVLKRFSLSTPKDENGCVNSPTMLPSGRWVKDDTPHPLRSKSQFSQSADPLPLPLDFASPLRKSRTQSSTENAALDEEFVLKPKKGSMFEKALHLTKSSKKQVCVTPSGSTDVYVPDVKKTPLTSFKNINPEFLDQVQEDFEEIEKPKESKPRKPTLSADRIQHSDKLPSTPKKDLGSDNAEVDRSRSFEDTSKNVEQRDMDIVENGRSNGRRGSKRKVSASHPQQESFGDLEDVFGADDPFIEETALSTGRSNKRLKSESMSWSGSIIKDGNIERKPSTSTLSIRPVEVDDFRSAGQIESAAANEEDDDESCDKEEKKTKKKKAQPKKVGSAKSLGGGGGGRGGGGAAQNQNFVRLNMKVKTYRRRGGGKTGGQMKRLQWKQKMASRAQSRGSGCFKCGEEGHWARNCKGKPGESKTVEDDAPPPEEFPSLGDAMRMAHGKPQRTKKKKETSGQEGDDKVEEAAENAEGDTAEKTEEDASDDILEELELVRQRQSERDEDIPRPPPTKPLFELTADGKVPEAPPAVYKALATFGYTTFRPGQEAAVMRILCGQTTLVQLSTGAGKSLCYQLPALMYAQRSTCITLVISPLVSLMEDQVTGLPDGLSGACLHTNMTKPQREKVAAAVEAGEVHFLLLSPEALTRGGNWGLLNFSKLPPIAFACIDEAHCVSSWSHNFRPSYLRVCKVLREKLGVNCLLGLTATATRATALNVAEHIGVSDGEDAFIRGKVCPPNLVLSASKDDDRDRALLQMLQGERFSTCHSIIIYCTRRETTERLATLIRTNLKEVKHTTKIHKNAPKSKSKKVIQSTEAYHAGLRASDRKRVQLNFMNGSLRIVVATVAFGMGLDKQDVHGIIHYNMPRNFESYVQETGRAGRDGNISHCHVFLDERGNDLCELKRHIHADTVDRVTVKKFVNNFFPSCRCQELHERFQSIQEDGADVDNTDGNVCPRHERAVPIEALIKDLDMKEEGISTLLCYLELDESRMVEILNPVYATCAITSHSGQAGFNTAAAKCPALAVAIAQSKLQGKSLDGRYFTFSPVDVADKLGTTSGIVKREISNLKWNKTVIGGYQRSSLLIEYSDLAFHIRCRGNLTDEEMDQLVDLLHDRITAQEENALQHLNYFCNILHSIAHKNLYMCADEADMDRSDRLKVSIRKYFDFNQIHLPTEELDSFTARIEQPVVNEDCVCADVRQFIHLYSDEHTLNARCITRIFHGIPSPNYPPEVWGRVRRFWRCHLAVDFNHLLRLARRTLMSLK